MVKIDARVNHRNCGSGARRSRKAASTAPNLGCIDVVEAPEISTKGVNGSKRNPKQLFECSLCIHMAVTIGAAETRGRSVGSGGLEGVSPGVGVVVGADIEVMGPTCLGSEADLRIKTGR